MGIETLPDFMTIQQLAEALQTSKRTIIRQIQTGALKAFKVGREWRIEKSDVIAWMKK